MESSGQIPFPVRVRERAQWCYQSAGSLGDNLACGRLDADDDGGRLLAVVPGNLLGSALGAPSFCVTASAAALGRATRPGGSTRAAGGQRQAAPMAGAQRANCNQADRCLWPSARPTSCR